MINTYQSTKRYGSISFMSLFLLMVLVACDSLTPPVASNSDTTENNPVSLFVASAETPEMVFEQFMVHWNAREYDAMYNLLSSQSQEFYARDVFENRYTVANERINLDTVTYNVLDTQVQGMTAAVTYDANLASPVFGVIADEGRIMRMVQTGNTWRIAWTPMDILNGLASDVTLQVDSRFPVRANIYDRDGEILAESNGNIVVIGVIQQDMANVDRCIDILAETMMRSRNEIALLFNGYNFETYFQIGELDRDIYFSRRDEIDNACALNVDSGAFTKVGQYTNRRYYGGAAMAHAVGFVGRVPGDQLSFWQNRGYQAGDIVGRSAIEFTYDADLAGQPERVLRLLEPGGSVIRELAGATGSPPTPVQLTLDRNLQYQTAKAINDAFNYAGNNWGSVATGGAAVVMDVNTGEILAIASYPSFDPNLFNPDNAYPNPVDLITAISTDFRSPLSNKAVQETYTPGSVYKIITTATTASEGVWDSESIFECDLTWEGQARFGDAIEFREDWRVADELEAAGPITMSQALTASCNPFFWEMGAIMFEENPNLLADYSQQIGLAVPTGLTVLAPEVTGSLANPTSSTEAINNAIGQGSIQITAVQMVRAVAAVANGGTLIDPYIVQQIGGLDDTEVQQVFEASIRGELDWEPFVYDVVRQGMCDVTIDEDLGTAYSVFNDAPFTSCGKTGTAEAGSRGSGIPPHAWYASYAPRENPEIAVVVVVPNSREGSQVAAPITRRIMDHYFGEFIKPFPQWWEENYVPLEQPAGVEGIG